MCWKGDIIHMKGSVIQKAMAAVRMMRPIFLRPRRGYRINNRGTVMAGVMSERVAPAMPMMAPNSNIFDVFAWPAFSYSQRANKTSRTMSGAMTPEGGVELG